MLPFRINSVKDVFRRWPAIVAVGTLMIAPAGALLADSANNLAPPLDSGYSAQDPGTPPATDQTTAAASAANVFNWGEVPLNQKVELTRATFDEGGYQLYDTEGETIVVPFTNNNLYVMKFARSDSDTMYFVNTGDAPVLYVSNGEYLENAAVPGAKWYPFPQAFHPATPIYLGIAPSWDAFIGIGWCSGEAYRGGYWSDTAYSDGGFFEATSGFAIFFGGHSFVGFDDFRGFCFHHPEFVHIGFFNHNFHRPWLARAPLHRFYGGHGFDRGHEFDGNHGVAADGHGFGDGGHAFRVADHSFTRGGGHNPGASHRFIGGHDAGGNHRGGQFGR